MEPNEIDKFFNDLPTEDKKAADVFEEKPVAETEATVTPEEGDEPRKNRRHRRLEAQLATEREARIAAEARAMGYAEAREKSQELGVDERLLRMYGTDDNGKEAARLHMELLTEERQKAKEEAIAEIEEAQSRSRQEEAKFESFIDDELADLEDTYNVDLTSDSPAARKARRELLEKVEKLSPKDEDGNIKEYADFDAVFEEYVKDQKKPDATRNKDVASRSMTNSGSSAPAPAPTITPGFRGWMKDYNVNS